MSSSLSVLTITSSSYGCRSGSCKQTQVWGLPWASFSIWTPLLRNVLAAVCDCDTKPLVWNVNVSLWLEIYFITHISEAVMSVIQIQTLWTCDLLMKDCCCFVARLGSRWQRCPTRIHSWSSFIHCAHFLMFSLPLQVFTYISTQMIWFHTWQTLPLIISSLQIYRTLSY